MKIQETTHGLMRSLDTLRNGFSMGRLSKKLGGTERKKGFMKLKVTQQFSLHSARPPVPTIVLRHIPFIRTHFSEEEEFIMIYRFEKFRKISE